MLRGDDVADLQTRLGDLGFFADRVDGILGPQTAAAITDFQRNSGLTADGICGPDTVAALHRVRRRTPAVGQGRGGRTRAAAQRAPPAGRPPHPGRPARRSRRADHARCPPGPGRGRRRLDPPRPVGPGRRGERLPGRRLPRGGPPRRPGCRCSYYGRPDYESAGGRRLAERLAEVLPDALDGTAGTTHPMQLPVLRETRMVAVWCEIGLAQVVEAAGGHARGGAVLRRLGGAGRSRVDPHLRLTTAAHPVVNRQGAGSGLHAHRRRSARGPRGSRVDHHSAAPRPIALTRVRADPTGLFELGSPGGGPVDAAGVRSGSRASRSPVRPGPSPRPLTEAGPSRPSGRS